MALKDIKAAQAKQFIEKQAKRDASVQRRLDSHKKEDGWINTLSGVGDAFRDKRLSSYFARDNVSWDVAEGVWRSDSMAARVVECLPDEMTREGFEIQVQDEIDGEDNEVENAGDPPKPKTPGKSGRTDADMQIAEAGANAIQAPNEGQPDDQQEESETDQTTTADDSKRVAELMMARCEDLDVLNKVRQALYFSRAYGGGAILVGANDGQTDWSKPLKLDAIRSIDFLNVLEPRELLPIYYYGDPRAPKYGEPQIYQLNRIMVAGEVPAAQAYLQIHESRLVRFDGIRVGRRQLVANAGWGDSIFSRVLQTVQDFQNVWQGAALIISDFGQAMLKIKGLAEMVAKNGKAAVQARAQAIQAARSITGLLLIDAEEDFDRKATPLSGFPEMLDRFCNRLAADVKIPVTILMGQAPAGLNATGQADLEWFSNQVRAEQQRHMKRPLLYLLKLMFRDQSGPTGGVEPTNWSVKFHPLKQMSEMDKADVRLKTSQADAADIASEVLLPAEVAKSRFGGDGYSTETHVDLELRAQTRAAVQEDPGDGDGPPSPIDDPFHTGSGEPGSEKKEAPPPPPIIAGPAGKPVAKKDEQDRDENGEFAGGGSANSDHERAAKEMSTHELAKVYHHAISSKDNLSAMKGPQFKQVTKELKKRGVTTIQHAQAALLNPSFKGRKEK